MYANLSPTSASAAKASVETPEGLFKQAMARYPDCPDLPPLPKSAAKWSEAQFDVYVASMGLVIPQIDLSPSKEGEVEASPIAAGEKISGEAHIKGLRTADACLVIPSQIYMEDRAPEGLKFEAILTKFDRCRAAALQSICGVNLRLLADDYGVGILLSDLSLVIDACKPPPLISAASVESEIDLPKLPLVPSRQRLVDENGQDVCHAAFGQLLVELATKRLSMNEEAYKRLKTPCNQIFGRDVPNAASLAVHEQLAAKLSGQWTVSGRLFTPQKYFKGKYVVAPSDCDTYDTVYHPKVATVCEHACLSTGERFCCEATTAFFASFIAPLPPGLQLIAHIFVELASPNLNSGTRALFVFEEEGKDCSCALCAFAVYGGALPGFLYQEEVQAVNKKNAQALIKWVTHGSWESSGAIDLSELTRQ